MWSIVADCLATMRGCTVGAWLVAKTAQYVVAMEMPAAHTNGSSTTPPLCCIPAFASPFQRAKASNASKPAPSASFAARKEFSHVGRYASGAVVWMEPTVLVAKVPSFSLFLLKRGFRAWPGVVTKLLLERSKFAVGPASARSGRAVDFTSCPRTRFGTISKRCQVPVPHIFERVGAFVAPASQLRQRFKKIAGHPI